MTSPTRDALIADLSRRLRPMCAEWPEHEFIELIERIADVTMKYNVAGLSISSYDRRAADRLIDDLKASLAESEARKREEDEDG
ncbi:MAG TPA: hypothetical protein VEB19_03490 [Gemmatimonadaceae bacterium]|nr:hypothetical protein [Gemmatimonadaceae bacterium]